MFPIPNPPDGFVDAFRTLRPTPTQHGAWTSTFSAVVRDARQATGRNIETGTVEDTAQAGNWLGTLGYLVMLDQVGKCFEPIPLPRPAITEHPVVKALTYFGPPDLDDDQILAIYALRCGFAHDYGLSNLNRGQLADQLTHSFMLHDDDDAPLVQMPNARWEGSYQLLSNRRTLVNVRHLGDLAEQVIIAVLNASFPDQLKVALPGGVEELIGRFAFQYYASP